MKVIFGLGNPGREYEITRHNIGFLTIDYIIKNHLSNVKVNSKFKSMIVEAVINNEKVIFVKPLTYMNLSGEAVRLIVDWYKIEIDDLLIIYDDLDLPVGKLRLREKGSAGGHNGMKSIIQHLGTDQFKRIKVGIDRPKNQTVVDYVLKGFSKEEQPFIIETIKEASEIVLEWIKGDNFHRLMSLHN